MIVHPLLRGTLARAPRRATSMPPRRRSDASPLSSLARSLILVTLAVLCGLPGARAQQPNERFEAGLAAFERGHYAIALRAFRAEADHGHALAQSNIGYLYERGLGVSQSYVEAMAWYRKAAAQKLPQAQFNIGTLYFYGHGVERNPREAVGWFRQAASQGLAEAQYMMGLAYYEGQGVMVDAASALEWLRKSATQGHAAAQMMAAQVHLSGDAGRPDPRQAYLWAEIAVRNGESEASLIRDYASYKLKASEIRAAQKQADACIASGYRDCAAR